MLRMAKLFELPRGLRVFELLVEIRDPAFGGNRFALVPQRVTLGRNPGRARGAVLTLDDFLLDCLDLSCGCRKPRPSR